MILIKNTQEKIHVDTKKLHDDAQKVLDLLGYSDFDLGIWLATNHEIHEYNKTYRDKDKPTDILSFPYHSEIKAGEQIEPQTDDDKNVGDIIIAPEYVKRDLPRWDTTFEKRMQILLVHGICHLLGYDHIKDEDYEIMKKQEELLLQHLS